MGEKISHVEFGSGVPTHAGFDPRLYLDVDSAIFYFKNPALSGTWSPVDASIDGLTATAAELNALDVSAANVAVTATDDGLTTGIIPDAGLITFVTVTSGSGDHIVVLPTPVAGKMVWLNVGANGFELRSSDPENIAINGGTEAAAESAIAASSTVLAICVSATAWKAIFLDADADVAKVEAAAAGA